MKAEKAVFFDLDETIYPEKDFRMSGFKEVARWLEKHMAVKYNDAFSKLIAIIGEKGMLYDKCFNRLCRIYHIDESIIPELIRIFRGHKPRIKPYSDFCDFMKRHNKDYYLGIITDGVGYVQRKKIYALKLNKWFTESAISITDEFMPFTDKGSPEVFIKACRIAGISEKDCVYIGDNPDKDFNNPSKLGWHTIRILRGIYANKKSNKYVNHEIKGYKELNTLLMRHLWQ